MGGRSVSACVICKCVRQWEAARLPRTPRAPHAPPLGPRLPSSHPPPILSPALPAGPSCTHPVASCASTTTMRAARLVLRTRLVDARRCLAARPLAAPRPLLSCRGICLIHVYMACMHNAFTHTRMHPSVACVRICIYAPPLPRRARSSPQATSGPSRRSNTVSGGEDQRLDGSR